MKTALIMTSGRIKSKNRSPFFSQVKFLGADLGNGQVVGENLRCYFHHWQFSGDGRLCERPCSKQKLPDIRLGSYPVREHAGYVWIYAGSEERTPLIVPPGLDGREVHALPLATVDLLAHHHVMFAGGIDLQHFSSVHNINIDFKADHRFLGDEVHEWTISGEISPKGWRGWLGRLLVGPRFTYRARLGAGSMIALTYGEPPRSRFSLPQLNVLWGCVPQTYGLSKVQVISLAGNENGLFGRLKMWSRHLLTAALLALLEDDDAKAFPNMRFEVANPMPEDRTILELMRAINQMPESTWTKKQNAFKDSASSIGL
jgi:phenylpropionate dioxygenase-like ring-hydroxylating dioxygenase large terminal subunit